LPLREKKERTLPMAMVPGSGVVVARAREGEGDVAGGRDHMAVRHRLRRGPPLVQECEAAGDAERDAVPCRQVGDGALVLRRLPDVKDHRFGEG
jgi:hypothetical protein